MISKNKLILTIMVPTIAIISLIILYSLLTDSAKIAKDKGKSKKIDSQTPISKNVTKRKPLSCPFKQPQIPKQKATIQKNNQAQKVDKKLVQKKEKQTKPTKSTPDTTFSNQPPPKEVKGDNFMKRLAKDIQFMTPPQIEKIKSTLLVTKKINPANFAIFFAKSKNEKVQKLGEDLITEISINRPDFFRPVEFYKILASNGEKSSYLLSEIISKTDDDFIREWACELVTEIYFHTSEKNDPRHIKLKEFKEREKKIYNFTLDVLNSPKEIDKYLASDTRISDQIVTQWGENRRYPLKMQALIKILDMLHKDNLIPTITVAKKIIKTYNYNYNILGRLDNKPVERANIPIEIKLKRLSNFVFQGEYQDTFLWVPKEQNGFTIEEMNLAIENSDLKEERKMLATLKQIISEPLKSKILIGEGNQELKMLRYFTASKWDKNRSGLNDKLFTIENTLGADTTLLLSNENKKIQFHIPERSTFIWSLPKGNYTLSTLDKQTRVHFESKTITITNSNITFVIK